MSNIRKEKINGPRTHLQEVEESLPPFIASLWSMVNEGEFVCWAHDGLSFVIMNQDIFESQILPRFFKHNKISSFVRQLNMYKFTKIGDVNTLQWAHEKFRRGSPHLLADIRRKSSEKKTDEMSAETEALHQKIEELVATQRMQQQRILELEKSRDSVLNELKHGKWVQQQMQMQMDQSVKQVTSLLAYLLSRQGLQDSALPALPGPIPSLGFSDTPSPSYDTTTTDPGTLPDSTSSSASSTSFPSVPPTTHSEETNDFFTDLGSMNFPSIPMANSSLFPDPDTSAKPLPPPVFTDMDLDVPSRSYSPMSPPHQKRKLNHLSFDSVDTPDSFSALPDLISSDPTMLPPLMPPLRTSSSLELPSLTPPSSTPDSHFPFPVHPTLRAAVVPEPTVQDTSFQVPPDQANETAMQFLAQHVLQHVILSNAHMLGQPKPVKHAVNIE